jgi:hypothetical protein
MRRRQLILGLVGTPRRRSFSASLVGDHPQEDLAKTFLQVKAAAISFLL